MSEGIVVVEPTYPAPPLAYGGIQQVASQMIAVLGERYGERQHVLANGGSTLESVDSATLYPITDPNTIFNDLRGEARADAYNTARDNAIRTTRHLLATGRMSFVETYWEDPLLTRELAKLVGKFCVPLLCNISCTPDQEVVKTLTLARAMPESTIVYTALSNVHKDALERALWQVSPTPDVSTTLRPIETIGCGIIMPPISGDYEPLLTSRQEPNRLSLKTLKENGYNYIVHIAGVGSHKGQRLAQEVALEHEIPLIIAGAPNPHYAPRDDVEYARDLRWHERSESSPVDRLKVESTFLTKWVARPRPYRLDAEGFAKYFGRSLEESRLLAEHSLASETEVVHVPVHYMGEIPKEFVSELYKFALFSIFASSLENQRYQEAYCLGLAESASMGCPVLGYRGRGTTPFEELIETQGMGIGFDSVSEAIDRAPEVLQLDRRVCAARARGSELDITVAAARRAMLMNRLCREA